MEQPIYRGLNKETREWVYGFGWFKTDYTEEHLIKIEQTEQDAVLLTDSGPEICYLRTMGRGMEQKVEGGQTIFVGDILEDCINGKRYEVIWDNYGMFLFHEYGNNDGSLDYYEFEDVRSKVATVIVGDIFTTPELAKAI